MDRGQILGGAIGLVALLITFLLPFSAIAEGPGGSPDTFIGIFKLFVTTLANIQAVGLTQLTELAYVYMTAFVLILISGIIGGYPRWSVIFTVVGMAMVTVAPFAIFPSYDFFSSNYSFGFYGLWITSAAMVYAAFWSGKLRRRSKANLPQNPTPSQTTSTGKQAV